MPYIVLGAENTKMSKMGLCAGGTYSSRRDRPVNKQLQNSVISAGIEVIPGYYESICILEEACEGSH